MKNNKNFFRILLTCFLTFGFSLSLQSLLAVWTSPNNYPPLDNVSPPVYNEHPTPDISALVNMPLGVNGDIFLNGKISVNGSTSNQGSITIQGSKPGTYTGINFRNNSGGIGGTLIVDSGINGVYKNDDVSWDWYSWGTNFNKNGNITANGGYLQATNNIIVNGVTFRPRQLHFCNKPWGDYYTKPHACDPGDPDLGFVWTLMQ